MRILVVEDNPDVQSLLKARLEEKCCAVDIAGDGEKGLYHARTNEYDAILLDYDLPLKNGYDLCRELRARNTRTPIIVVSAASDVDRKVEGFGLGVDDYVTKPFFFEEVYARLQTVLRRPAVRESSTVSIGDFSIDTDAQHVTVLGAAVYLTRKEYAILEYLAKNAGSVMTRGAIMEHVWDMDADPFSNAVETHVRNIRRKIEPPGARRVLFTVPGRGYKLDHRA